MYPARISLSYIDELMRRIAAGEALSPQGEGWDIFDMLQVAAAMFFSLRSRGPIRVIRSDEGRPWVVRYGDPRFPAEEKEAVETAFRGDILGSIEFIMEAILKRQNGTYDLDPEVLAHISVEDGKRHVQFLPYLGDDLNSILAAGERLILEKCGPVEAAAFRERLLRERPQAVESQA